MASAKKTPNPIDIDVGARVRLRRNMIGLSQEKLGESLGVTFQQVQKYEKGTNRISASKMQKISEILKTPVSFFFGADQAGSSQESGFAETGESNYIADYLSTPEDIQLFKAFSKIDDPKVRKNIINMVRSFMPEKE